MTPRTPAIVSRIRLDHFAGTKAPSDVRAVCRRLGWQAIDLDASGSNRRRAVRAALEMGPLLTAVSRRGAADVLLAQYPLGRPADRAVATLGRGRKVALVHDLDSLRGWAPPDHDRANLERYDCLIVHSPQMQAWVAENVRADVPTVTLGMFDYLVDGPYTAPAYTDRPDRMYLVANLDPAKAQYLYRLGPLAVPFEVYGPNCDSPRLPAAATWCGVLDISRPRIEPVRGFGLVWDGTDPSRPQGDLARYLGYNAPHKLSFYLAAGIPVIVPDHSAVAPLVRDNDLGRCAASVGEAADLVEACTADEWRTLAQNVARFGARVRQGEHTAAAVTAALRVLTA